MSKTNRKSNDRAAKKAVMKLVLPSAKPPQKFDESRISAAMREYGWACVQDRYCDGVVTRTVISPRSGKLVRFGNLKACGSFDEAVAALDRYPGCAGVAFMYTPKILSSDLDFAGGWIEPKNIGKLDKNLDRFQHVLAKLCD